MNDFSKHWKSHPFELPRLEKASQKLSQQELAAARALIKGAVARNVAAFETIRQLQKRFKKLRDQPDAARVYWTETKRQDVRATRLIGEDIGFSRYKVILSPHACKVCIAKTDGGRREFSDKDLRKRAYGAMVPFHPSCYCIVVPVE